ncbi:MAG: hypothetical protein QOI77_544, partial [Blastocatellia bacterium]|nr:hypothetical protein [Blastocatellia bacterium]
MIYNPPIRFAGFDLIDKYGS